MTEGAEFVSEITDTDIKKHYDSTVQLSKTYNIRVVAMATGYTNCSSNEKRTAAYPLNRLNHQH